ncbi:MAG: SDR family NAD(P)-dependent oxidoreductase [Gammaproteobacteria bacterium]|nr:SDR family NAD(P)-dependent oxidoreductase [Gammaproteobacteria bacterium]
MSNPRPVALVTGSSRGIGKALAIMLAKKGYDLVICGKTTQPHPKLQGSLPETESELHALGATVLSCSVDIRMEDQIQSMFQQIEEKFGRLDVLINNASAIDLSPVEKLSAKKYDLMQQVNVRGSFLCAQAAYPLLKHSPQAHVLSLSPPIDLNPKWFNPHLGYTISKYGMSMLVLGLSAAWKADRIAVNALWPATIIKTAAIEFNFPPALLNKARTVDIVADAAAWIVSSNPETCTGNFFVDEDVLRAHGLNDFSAYAVDPTQTLFPDLYLSR